MVYIDLKSYLWYPGVSINLNSFWLLLFMYFNGLYNEFPWPGGFAFTGPCYIILSLPSRSELGDYSRLMVNMFLNGYRIFLKGKNVS